MPDRYRIMSVQILQTCYSFSLEISSRNSLIIINIETKILQMFLEYKIR